MKQSVLSLSQTLQEHLIAQRACCSSFLHLKDEILNAPSAKAGWSMGQCFWHLNSYSAYYHPAMEQAIQRITKKGEENLKVKGSWLGAWFARLMQPGKMKFKAFPKHVPPSQVNGRDELMTLITNLEVLQNLIQKAEGHDWDQIPIPISLSKWVKLPLGDVFQFLLAHNDRHLAQAEQNVF